jgi:ligand-binding SRPBCC domain-containing protein
MRWNKPAMAMRLSRAGEKGECFEHLLYERVERTNCLPVCYGGSHQLICSLKEHHKAFTEPSVSELFVLRSAMPASAEAVYQWHALPGALTRLTPPWERAQVVEETGGIEELGSRVKLRVSAGPITRIWTSEHTAFERGRMFRDTMVAGPFRKWEHTHLFIPDTASTSWLEDRVEFVLPLGQLGKILACGYTHRRLQHLFAWRHGFTAQALVTGKIAHKD